MRLLLFVVPLLISFALPPTAHATTLAYWRFENGTAGGAVSGAGSVLDSASGFDGSPVGGPTYSADIPVAFLPLSGASNSVSLDLRNGNDYVAIADPTSILIPTNAITVELWLRSGGVQPESQVLVVDHSHGWSDSTGWALQSAVGSTQIDFVIGTGTSFELARSTTNVFDGGWHHVAGVYDQSDIGQEIKLYVDGQLEAATASIGFAPNTRDVNIGSSWHGSLPQNRFFHGLVDEVRISDVALNASQFLLAIPEPSLSLLGLVGCTMLTCRRHVSR